MKDFVAAHKRTYVVEMNKTTKKDLVIVTILTDKNLDSAKEFIKTNKLEWDFLPLNGQESLIDDYKLRVLPTYFLIDPQGMFNLSPAPSPDENFLAIFQSQIRLAVACYENTSCKIATPWNEMQG